MAGTSPAMTKNPKMLIHLDTQADLEDAVRALVKQDPRLKPVFEIAGMPSLRRREPGFAGLAHIVCGYLNYVCGAEQLKYYGGEEMRGDVVGLFSEQDLFGPGDPDFHFDFGFPETPTNFQKNLMRFAFLPTNAKRDGWRTEYGRPDIPYMLKGFSKQFGRRTCVYVCGPPGMRTDVANTVAKLQSAIWTDKGKDEIFLHAENYGL